MGKVNNCLLFIGENADLNIVLLNFLFCVIFHNRNNTINANAIASNRYDKELQGIADTLEQSRINYIPYKEIHPQVYDYVISIYGTNLRSPDKTITPQKMFICAKKNQDELKKMGIESERIIPCPLLCDSKFSIEFFKSLKENPPTILSNQCFSRYSYFSLGTEFFSPFVNITLSGKDLLKIAKSPKEYLEAPINYYKEEFINGKIIPTALLADEIKLNLTHYKNFNDFSSVWKKRIKRINYNNLVVTLQADSRNDVSEFTSLNYSKKLCFFEEKSEFSINLDEIDNKIIKVDYSNYKKLFKEIYKADLPEHDFNSVVNHFGMRCFPIYSLIGFIKTGTLTTSDINTENMLSEYIRKIIWG